MAIAPLVVAVRTFGANQLNNLSNAFRRTAASIRVSWNRTMNSIIQRGGIGNVLQQGIRNLPQIYQRSMHRLNSMMTGGGRSITRQFTPIGGAAGSAFAVAFVAAAGAAINGLLVTGLGLGTMAAGIAGALKSDPALRGVWGDLFKDIGSDFKRMSGVFVQPLLGAAEKFREVWNRSIGPGLGKAFEDLAPHLENVSDGFANMFGNAMPGFNKAIGASGGLLDKFGLQLARMGDAFSSFFESISDGGDGMAKGLHAVMLALNSAVRVLGETLEHSSKIFDSSTNFAEDYAKALGKINPIAAKVGEGLERFNFEATKSTEITDLYGEATNRADYANKQFAQSASLAAKAAFELSNKLHGLVSDQLSATEAELAWQESIDNLTQSFREHGKTVNADTEAGRANVRTILEAVEAAERKRQAAINLAGGEHASAAAIQAANAEFSRQLDSLRALLKQLGLTDAQIDGLLASYQAVAAQHDIVKTITIRYQTLTVGGRLMKPSEFSGEYSSGIGGRASGGPVKAGTPYLVGEKGPELITPTRAGYVHDAASTARMAGGGGRAMAGGRAPTLIYDGSGGLGGIEAAFYKWLEHSIRAGRLRVA